MDIIWNKTKEILVKSKYKMIILEEGLENGYDECEKLNIPEDSVLASVVKNCNGIYIDNWIRILGQGNEKQKGVLYYNTLVDDSCIYGMFIVANDVVGGIYAINISKYENDKNLIWYFAPDTLEWECLDMNYSDFIAWVANGNISEFYETMRWNDWTVDCEKIEFDKACLIYPFLWAKECEINSAEKKTVPFEELMRLNFDYHKMINS